MAAAHTESEADLPIAQWSELFSSEQRSKEERKRRRAEMEALVVTPPATLDALLADTTFWDFGRLKDYREYDKDNIDHHAAAAVALVEKLQQKHHLELSPLDQVSLVIRYVVTREYPNGLNYYSNTYGGDHMARDLALAGYEDKTGIRAKTWEKLMHEDRLRKERATRRRHIRPIPIDPSPSLPLPLTAQQTLPAHTAVRR